MPLLVSRTDSDEETLIATPAFTSITSLAVCRSVLGAICQTVTILSKTREQISTHRHIQMKSAGSRLTNHCYQRPIQVRLIKVEEHRSPHSPTASWVCVGYENRLNVQDENWVLLRHSAAHRDPLSLVKKVAMTTARAYTVREGEIWNSCGKVMAVSLF